MSARPEFLAYSPADIVAMGRERGADADAIARAVNTHRSNLEAYGRENHPDTYWDATGKLDRDSQEALDSVRSKEQQRLLQERLDPAQQQEFTSALEAAAYDPDKIDPTWQSMATELAAQSDRFRLPAQRIHGGKITVGDTALARYSMRESGDGMMDARIEFDDGSSGLERIAKASDEDVQAEIAREEQRRQALLTEAEEAKRTAPWLPVVQQAELSAQQAQDAQGRIDRLKAGGVRALMGERVTDALKTGKLKDKVGQYALGQDFLKGLVGASLDTGIMVNRFAGSQADMDELLAAKQEMDAALPGSTRPGFDGSLLGSAVRDASGSAGAMLPGMIGGGGAKLLANATELAAINAGKTGAMGAIMAAQGYGAGYAESEQEARAAEAAGDVAKAQRIRSLREVHALLSAGTDALTERIGDLNLIKSPGRGLKALGSIAKEGIVEEGLAQVAKDVAINPLTLEREATLDNVPGAMLAGGLAAAPLAGFGAAISRRDQRFANVTDGSPPEAPPGSPALDGLGDAGSTPAVGASSPSSPTITGSNEQMGSEMPVPAPAQGEESSLSPVQRKMAVRSLVSQGVEPEVAASAVDHLGITPDMAPEALRDHVLQTFQERGGQLPAALPKRHLDQPEAYMAQGYTAEESQTHANNSRAVHQQDVQAAHDANRQLVTTINEAAAQRAEAAAQDAAAEAALAIGPKSLMDVATRAGKVNSPRLQFSYKNVPNSLMGFPRNGPTKPYAEQSYPHEQPVRVTWPDGQTIDDAVKGLNPAHALERARRNWPGATIEPLTKLQFSKVKEFIDMATAKARLAAKNFMGQVELGSVTPNAARLISKVTGIDATGTRVNLRVDAWQHADKKHGAGSSPSLETSKHRDQVPLESGDIDKVAPTALDPEAVGFLLDADQLRRAANDPSYLPQKEHFSLINVKQVGDHFIVATTLPNWDGVSNVRSAYKRKVRQGLRAEDVLQEILQDNASKAGRAQARPETTALWQKRQQHDANSRQSRNQPSRSQPGTPLRTRVKSTRAVAQQASRILNQQLPGIVGPKLTFVTNPAELLASNYAGKDSFTPAEIAQMQDAEAFFDNDTGHTIVFTDAIEVRPGESERAAVARVILHERVGHDGFNVLHQNDAQFRAKWNSIAKDIPSAELDAIARDYPHLAGDKHQLALEWFARAVEQRLHLKEGNLARRLWLAFKAFVQRLRDGFANTEAWVHEDALKELITKAREAAQRGTAVPTTAEGLRQRLQFTGDAPQRDDLDLGEAVAQIEAFYADPVETDYWPTDLVKKWEDDPLRVAVEDDGDFLAAVPHLPEALRNSPQVQAWTAAYQRYDELQRKSLNTPLTAAEADESDALEDPTNEALDWLDSPDVQSALASRKSALETTVEARAAQTIQQIESTGRYKWNRKSKSFDYVDDSDIRVQFSLASQPVPADSPAGLLEYDYRDESSLSEPERRALAGVRREYGRDVQPVSPRAARPDYRLTPRQAQTRDREGADIAEAFKVVFFKTFLFVDGPGSLHGASADNSRNVLIVNLHSEQPLLWIAGHELTHSLAAQQPELYAELKRAVLAQARDWSDYRAKRLANGYPEAEIADEFVADFVGAQFLEPGFMNRLAQEQPSLFARLAAAIKRFLDAVLGRAAKLDRDVRPYFQDLTALRDQLASTLGEYSQRGQFPDNPLQGTGKLNKALGGTRVRHTPGQPFKVRALGLQTLRTGSPLPPVVHEVMQSTVREQQALDNAFARVASMIERGADEAVKRTGQPLTAIYDRINAALDGQPSAMTVLQVTDPALAEATRRGRNMLDDMSQLIANTLPAGPGRNAIIGNMGHWMRRSFQVFDASAGWNYTTLREAAEAGKQLNGEDARLIMREAAAYLVQQDPSLANQRAANGLPRKDTELSKTFDELLNRDTWTTSLVPGGKSARKNVTSLIRRKDMAPQLRRLMGEHTNPLNRFATSASFQTQFVAKHKGLEAMRQVILQSGLGSTKWTDEFSAQMADNEGWNPLNGIYVTPELQTALQSVSTIDQAGAGHFADKAWKLLKALTANAKMNNVPLNPKSTATNIIGGLVASIQTGDLYAPDFVDRWTKAWRASKSGEVSAKELQDITTVGLRDAEAQLRQELIATGVMDSNLTLQEFQAGNAEYLVQIFGDDPKFQKAANAALGAAHGAAIGNALGRIGGPVVGQLTGIAIGATAGAVIGGKNLIAFNQFIAKWAIGKPDALFKITGYLAQLRTAQLAGVPNPQAWAAERVRNTYPTYDKVPAWLRTLSLTPVAGSFVNFSYEVPRNAIWNVRYGLQDLRSGNPELIKSGVRRLSGAALVWGGLALGVSSSAVAAFMGWEPPDDEKKRIFKQWLSPDYEQDSTLTFTGFDQEGVTYFNHAYLVPQVVWTDFIRIAASDMAEGDWDKAIFGSMGRLYRIAGGGNNMFNTMVEAYNNRDRFGKKITADGRPEDTTLDRLSQYARRADHVAATYTDPGYARFAVEYIRAASLNDDSAAIERLNDGVMGLRSRHVPWDKAAKTAAYKFRDQLQAVRDTLDDRLDPKKATFTTNRQAALNQANAERAKIAVEFAKFEADMAEIKMPRAALQEAKKVAGIGSSIKALALDPTGTKAVTTKTPVQ